MADAGVNQYTFHIEATSERRGLRTHAHQLCHVTLLQTPCPFLWYSHHLRWARSCEVTDSEDKEQRNDGGNSGM